ncbi:MAG: polysaccharide biosynthesis protein [Fretibacterium sp.]|nr:polysaccharide biosynthesis protein [Fretibacterium sp.]
MSRIFLALMRAWDRTASHGFIVALLDFLFLSAAVYLGYAIRLTLFIPRPYILDCFKISLLFSSLTLLFFCAGRQYRVLWPQAGLEDYVRFVRLYASAAFCFVLLNALAPIALLPRTSLVILLLAGVIFCGALRISWRLPTLAPNRAAERQNVLIVGAGEAGTLLARDLMRNPSGLAPLGFVDDDPHKIGKCIADLTVLGTTEELPRLIEEKNVRIVLVAIPSVNRSRIRAIYEALAPLAVEVRVLPSLKELAGGQITISRLRNISLGDLLGRDPVRIDIHSVAAYLAGRSVLVTGAGGSIGSEIVRQVLQNRPREIFLLGHGEQSLYLLLEELSGHTTIPLHPVVADVADLGAMREFFQLRRPQVVFHAAAHKHVPLMELWPREALRVNALGTRVVARAAGEEGAERMVLISTDKAVNPSSIMGASKRVAEMMLEQEQKRFPATAFMAVRFGNVLGSRGSVIPKFERQIAEGGPVTVTAPGMKRYFMLIPEAVSLVIQAGSMGQGGELFALDMGEPVPILEMAELLIRLHGYEPYRDIPIVFTGVRKGEKLEEELFYDLSAVHPTSHSKVFAIPLSSRPDSDLDLDRALEEGLKDSESALAALQRLVPEFCPQSADSRG